MKKINTSLLSLIVIINIAACNSAEQTPNLWYDTQQATEQLPPPNSYSPPQQNRITTRQFVEPQYGAYSFQYPTNYQVNGGFLNNFYPFPYATLAKNEDNTLIFLNDKNSLAYMDANQVMFAAPGQVYMGCLLVNNMDEPTHARIALERKGFGNIRIGNMQPVQTASGGTRNMFPVSCTDAYGKQYHGKMFVTTNNTQGTPMIAYSESGFLTTGNIAEAEQDYQLVSNSFQLNEQVLQKLTTRYNDQILDAISENQRYVEKRVEQMQQFDQQMGKHAQKSADIIGGNTQRYNPYTGEQMIMEENYDPHYFIDANGNVITNSTGISPGADFQEMPEDY
ncbi:MAG: hypothetical protein R2798_09280 [Chitinophagales bacterium]|nr:hypothetical protein [Bacteroidota bacterium]